MKLKNTLFFILLIFSLKGFSQKDSLYYEGLIQFSGVVVSTDSINPIPFAHIIDISTRSGTTSDYFGYFSFVSKMGDSVRFSSVGYKTSYFQIPDTLISGDNYSLIHIMEPDTILLKQADIYPWPSKEQFAQAFINADIPNDDLKRAEANLNNKAMNEYAQMLPMNGQMNFNWQMQQVQNRLYYSGQYPPMNILNPLAWAKFIKAWKDGDFKNKDE